MSPGKIAAQAGHAFLNSYLKSLEETPEFAAEYQNGGIGTKVCLKAKSLSNLKRAHIEALEANLPCSLIVDSGHIMPPFFDGKPIVTALGIGPVRRDQIDSITKRFNLL